MALTDINFSQGEGQDFILEIAAGSLNAPADILIEPSAASYPVNEIAEEVGGGSNIFIMSE